MTGDYTQVTEVPGVRLTREAMAMMYTRYRFAAEHAEGGNVLEIACGAGQGLGLLARRARRVVGGDLTERLVQKARRHYGSRALLLALDGQALPFRSASFDVALLFEAIYYLTDAARCLAECRRVLRTGGRLILCSVNRMWEGFNPSPHSVRYYAARELSELLEGAGFDVELFGAYRDEATSGRSRLVSAIRSTAVALHLVPKTMKGKELLKRIFYGPLLEMPAELLEAAAGEVDRPEPLPQADDSHFRVVYAVGKAR